MWWVVVEEKIAIGEWIASQEFYDHSSKTFGEEKIARTYNLAAENDDNATKPSFQWLFCLPFAPTKRGAINNGGADASRRRKKKKNVRRSVLSNCVL